MTRCPKCSGENAETQRFCGECGTPLPLAVRPPGPGPDETIPLPSADLPPGTLFARRYQVVEELGSGGMGRVYRVIDKKLDEEIALKVIRPDIASDRGILARFSTELKLARQVVHRSVARMFDLNEEAGVPYLTMEYVKGEDLRHLIRKVGRMSAAQAVPLACQICDGLAEAHRLGIVHHDLKPQNVMIDEDGQAKIMDFGLARLLAKDGPGRFGSRSGSPAYVSPEQIKGRPADGRSDLYSLGVLMYEMLTGSVPFKAENIGAIMDKHLYETPEDPRDVNPAVSAELSQIILKCLEKDPRRRYQSAAELRAALGGLPEVAGTKTARGRRTLKIAAAAVGLAAVAAVVLIIAPPERWKRSVAVLPVEDASLEPANPVLLSGLQREVTDRLSSIPNLRVLPVASVNSYDLKGRSLPQIGKTLDVAYLLKVVLDVEGPRVEAKIYLLDPRRDLSPAPMIYSKELTSYRALQDEIAVLTAKALGVELDPENLKKFRRRGTDNIEAYSSFLEGMSLLERGGEGNVQKAVALFGRAVEIDPGYALGHWGLGYAYEHVYYNRRENKDAAALARMYEEFNKASQLDPSFAETNVGLGWYFFNKGNNPEAFASFRKALNLEPDGYLVNRDAGAFLRSLGLYRQAIPYLNRAARLSPRDPLPLVEIAQCWLYLGQTEKALPYAERAVATRENDPDAAVIHASALILAGKLDQAELRIESMERLGVRTDRLPYLRELVTALREGRGKPHAFTAKPSFSPQGTYAFLLLGMTDEALSNIRTGIDRGFSDGMYLYSYPSILGNPWYKALRDDPRFQAILKQQKALYDKELKAFEKL